MLGKILLKFPSLTEGILIKRYKRFLADIKLNSGEVVTAHCPNTGPMKGVLNLGGKVRIRFSPSPSRKLSWTWEQAEIKGIDGLNCWVGVNTSLPNKLVRLAIEAGCFEDEFGRDFQVRQEVPYGKNMNSRIDLLLSPTNQSLDSRKIFIEVKNTTWSKGEFALFPDTVTKRGQKHLLDLIDVLPDSRGVLVPSIARPDSKIFTPGDEADPIYGNLFRQALSKGVEVIPCSFGFYSDHITWEGKRPFSPNQDK